MDVKLESQTPIATAAAGSRSGSRRGDVAKDVAVAEEVVGLVTKPTQVSVGVDGTAAAAANSREMTLAFHVVDSVGFARLLALTRPQTAKPSSSIFDFQCFQSFQLFQFSTLLVFVFFSYV